MLLAEVLRSTDLMSHQIRLKDIEDRRSWLGELCAGKSVLHVGCCDVPTFDPETNLHVYLARHTERLDGLDISQEGIAVLRRHVEGEYFTDAALVSKSYQILLAPEVLEHTPNPEQFLRSLFAIQAQAYLITAPHIQWFEQTRREGDVFHEPVHGDHRAWYSPYTLLNALRPFIAEDADDVEVFLLKRTGSVAVKLTKPARSVTPWLAPPLEPALSADDALRRALAHAGAGETARALRILQAAQATLGDARLRHAQVELLLGLGQNLEALRRAVDWLRDHPDDVPCLELCADAMQILGDPLQAAGLREKALKLRQARPT